MMMFQSEPDTEFLEVSGLAKADEPKVDMARFADRPDADRASQLFD